MFLIERSEKEDRECGVEINKKIIKNGGAIDD